MAGDYCTKQDLKDRYTADSLAKYADYDGDGVADDTVLEEAIDDAEGEINSYLGQQYSTPISPVPDVLRQKCAVLAFYFLQLRNRAVTEDYQQAYNQITSWLKSIAQGTITLGDKDSESQKTAGGVDYQSKPREFGRDKFL